MIPVHPETMRQIRQVLAELELISHGQITAYNSSGGAHGESEADHPPGESRPPHIRYRERFEDAETDERVEKVLGQARDELASIRVRGTTSGPVLSDREVMKRRILEDGSGWSVADVSFTFRCSVSMIRSVRIAAERNPDTGLPVLVEIPVDQAEHARRLLAQGMTERQVVMATGLPKSTVRRACGRAA